MRRKITFPTTTMRGSTAMRRSPAMRGSTAMRVSGNARVYGKAQVYGNAQVYGDARVSGDAQVSGNADYAAVAGFGRYSRTTTFFRCKDKILRVQCGCFYGDLAQFREIVKKTHGDSKYAKEYLAIADLMELHFSDECGGEQ